MSAVFAKHVTVTRTEYGAVVLDKKKSRYWQLNPTAVLVADALEAGGSVDDAARRVVAAFDVDAERAKRDVTELLAQWRAAGVLRR